MTPEETKEFQTQYEAIVESKASGWIVLSTGRTFYVLRNGQKLTTRSMPAGSHPESISTV